MGLGLALIFHFIVSLTPPHPHPKLSGVKQQPSYSHRFRGSGIRSGHSRDGLSLLHSIWGLSLEDPSHWVRLGWLGVGIIWRLLHSHVTWAAVTWRLGSAGAVDKITFTVLHVAWDLRSVKTGMPRGDASESKRSREPAEIPWPFLICCNKQVTKASPDCRTWEVGLCLKWAVGQRIYDHF